MHSFPLSQIFMWNDEDLSCAFSSLSEKYFIPVCCFLTFNMMDWFGRTVTTWLQWVSFYIICLIWFDFHSNPKWYKEHIKYYNLKEKRLLLLFLSVFHCRPLRLLKKLWKLFFFLKKNRSYAPALNLIVANFTSNSALYVWWFQSRCVCCINDVSLMFSTAR